MTHQKAGRIESIPPLRAEPRREDPRDGDRIAYVQDLWTSQSWALRQRDRQIEENVRMLAGQQWMLYSDLLGKWVDLSEVLDDDEKRWRQRPVINRLLYWFMLTHARMTENPPVVTFQPTSGDRADARLAEVMDTIHKALWEELEMLQVVDRMFRWLIPGGSAYLKTRIDMTRGPVREWLEPGLMQGPNGDDRLLPAIPFDGEGNPQVEFTDGGQGYRATGDPFAEHEGELAVEVLTPLEVRGQWGSNIPWRKKDWHLHRSLLTPKQVYETWGVHVEPDVSTADGEGAGEMQRLLFGSGYYGAAGNKPGSHGSTNFETGLVKVDELWMRPTDAVRGMKETPTSPGGRRLVVTKEKVLWDGARPVRVSAASPIQKFEFVGLPGRPDGTTPQEMLNPIQRTYNRGWAQILEHRNLVTNPLTILDGQSGIEEEQLTNKPGLVLKDVTRRPGVPAIEFVKPPPLSSDVYQIQSMLQDEQEFLGNLSGAQGDAPTRDASGELVKELRFNSDRYLGPTLRRAALTLQHVVEDLNAHLPIVWDREKVISYAGEDTVPRTVTVYPELFEEGAVNVRVDTESMLPEGRGEKQRRILTMYQMGLFGDPASPEARQRYFKLARFPHMGRETRPGGVDRITAMQENGQLIQGVPVDEIPVLQTYDHEVHVAVHQEFVNSPEFKKIDRQKQMAFMMHLRAHLMYLEFQRQQMIQQEAAQIAAMSAAQGGGGVGGAPGSGSPARELAQSNGDESGIGAGNPPGPANSAAHLPASEQSGALSFMS